MSREMECAGADGQTGVCRVPRSRGQETQLADSKVGISKLPGTGTDGGWFKMEAHKS